MEDDSLKSEDDETQKKSKTDSQQKKDEDNKSLTDEESLMKEKSIEIIHYLTPETEHKLKKYLKEGETQLTDIELQKRRK